MKNIGAIINDKHTFYDYGMIITNNDCVQPPEPYTYYVTVPGLDGELDLSETLTNDITYKNRKIVLELGIKRPKSEWKTIVSSFSSDFNGQKVKIIFDDDSEFYYVGRVTSISDVKRVCNIGTFTVEILAEPYKYKLCKTVYSFSINKKRTIACSNLRQRVIPSITSDSSMRLVFNNKVYDIQAGTIIIPDMQFVKGFNIIEATGTGTLKIEYQEGDL